MGDERCYDRAVRDLNERHDKAAGKPYLDGWYSHWTAECPKIAHTLFAMKEYSRKVGTFRKPDSQPKLGGSFYLIAMIPCGVVAYMPFTEFSRGVIIGVESAIVAPGALVVLSRFFDTWRTRFLYFLGSACLLRPLASFSLFFAVAAFPDVELLGEWNSRQDPVVDWLSIIAGLTLVLVGHVTDRSPP